MKTYFRLLDATSSRKDQEGLGIALMGVLAGRKAVKEPGQKYSLKCIGLG